jgi:hypothetical protein
MPPYIFQTALAVYHSHERYHSALYGLFQPGEVAVEVLPPLSGIQVFAYLFLRFGTPTWPWDQSRDMITYVLTTPVAGAYLSVTPHISAQPGTRFDDRRLMFGYVLASTLASEAFLTPSHVWETTSLYRAIKDGLRLALTDLLRPVLLDGQAINSAGMVTDQLACLPTPVGRAEIALGSVCLPLPERK